MSFRAHEPVELDFFKIEKENNSNQMKPTTSTTTTQFKKFMKQTSFRGIQKLNPELLKSVINSAPGVDLERKTPGNPFSVPSTPTQQHPDLPSPFPIQNPIPRCASTGTLPTAGGTPTGPLTIFYNGTVSVFDVPSDKVEVLMKLAVQKDTCSLLEGKKPVESKAEPSSSSSSSDGQILLERLNVEQQMRKKSLQRFLQKRKERLVFASPYASGGLGTPTEKSKETIQAS